MGTKNRVKELKLIHQSIEIPSSSEEQIFLEVFLSPFGLAAY
jgi:hypothetical protein